MQRVISTLALAGACVATCVSSASAAAPTFNNYPGPGTMVGDAGEPSIGRNPASRPDGGATFGPGVPIYTLQQCAQGLHGHLKVAPDGSAYVPVFDCGGKQAVAVSKDNGTSWSVEQIPGTTTQDESDPHLGIGSGGTLYFGYQGADGTDLGNKGYLADAF